MSDFQSALKGFQEDNQSLDKLLIVAEQMITRNGVNPRIILAELSEEHNKNPIPSKILATIKLRIQLAAALDENHGVTTDLDDTIIELTTKDDTIGDLDADKLPRTTEDPSKKVIKTRPMVNELTASVLFRKHDHKTALCQGLNLNGRYELVQHLGTGGMGSVYKAIDRDQLKAGFSNPHVAVKILNPKFFAYQNQFSRIQQEAQKCANLCHPNIVEVYECNHDGAMAYLVMEYLSGETLKDKIRYPGFEGFSIERALNIIADMGKALSFAHAQGIVHYDFKPNNVFITDDGQIKIIDFGIARAIHSEDETDHASSFHSAIPPVYASVEMFEHLPPDPRDDVFSLAITSYELITGRHPFKRKQAMEARNSGLHPKRPKDINQHQWEAFKKALEFERNRRTPEVSQFLKGIGAIEESQSRFFTFKNGIAASVVIILAGTSLYLNNENKTLHNHSDSPVPAIQSRLNHDTQETSEFAKLDINNNEISAESDHDDDLVEQDTQMEIDNQSKMYEQIKTVDITNLSPSSLLKAASAGDIETVKAFLSSNISSNSLMHSPAQKALILAAQAGHIDVMQVLLEAQVDLNHQGHQSRTALIWAVDQGHSEAVYFLLDRNADKNIRDAAGETALMRAIWEGHNHVVDALLDKESNVNSRYPDGLTLLSAAAINGYTHIAEALLEAGADPNLTSNLGRTPLMAAAWNGHTDMVQLLATRGSSLDKVSSDGWTALMNAAWGGHAKIVKILVMAGANPSIRGRNRATAAQVAKNQGHIKIAKFLENKIKEKPQTNRSDQTLTHLLHTHGS